MLAQSHAGQGKNAVALEKAGSQLTMERTLEGKSFCSLRLWTRNGGGPLTVFPVFLRRLATGQLPAVHEDVAASALLWAVKV
jgi:hypothetical protein